MIDAPTDEASACANCGARLHGPYCSACGQEARPLSPTVRDVLRELVEELFDVDGRTARSVRALFFSPGLLTREQFLGRRARWLSPLRLYLTFSVLYFAVLAVTGASARVSVSGPEGRSEAEGLRRLGFQTQAEMEQAIGRTEAAWMPRASFLLVPLFAWFVSRVRRDAGRTYPQHLQFALHAHAAWFGASAVAALGPLLPPVVRGALSALSILYGVTYVALALQVAYGGTRRRAVHDALLVLGVYSVAVGLAVLGVLVPIFLPIFRG